MTSSIGFPRQFNLRLRPVSFCASSTSSSLSTWAGSFLSSSVLPVFFLSSLLPGTLLILAFSSPSSLTTISACLGSASSSIPSSVQRSTLLRILTSRVHSLVSPSVSTFSLYLFSRVPRVAARLSSVPTATKSSPWTMMIDFDFGCLNRQLLAPPWTHPLSRRVLVYSIDQLSAASLVPYMLMSSLPHLPSSCPSTLSSSGSFT